jgi:hypothetical protein
MKLNFAQVKRTLSQLQGEAIPDNHPVVPQLNNIFGEHTFFLDGNGLSIVEPASRRAGSSVGQSCKSCQLERGRSRIAWSLTNPNRLTSSSRLNRRPDP